MVRSGSSKEIDRSQAERYRRVAASLLASAQALESIAIAGDPFSPTKIGSPTPDSPTSWMRPSDCFGTWKRSAPGPRRRIWSVRDGSPRIEPRLIGPVRSAVRARDIADLIALSRRCVVWVWRRARSVVCVRDPLLESVEMPYYPAHRVGLRVRPPVELLLAIVSHSTGVST